MKTTRRLPAGLLVLLTAGTLAGAKIHAQTPTLSLANRYASFTNLTDDVVQNAALIRADGGQLIFKTNDVYGTAQLTNLSPDTLEMLGITDSYLQKLRDSEKQRALAAAQSAALWRSEQQQLNDPASLTSVKVESVIAADYDASFGKLQRCTVRLTNGAAMTAWVARLPDTVPAYLQQQAALARDIAQLTPQIENGVAQVNDSAAQLNTRSAQLDQTEDQVGQSLILTPTVNYDGVFANPGFDVFNVRTARRSLTTASNQLDQSRDQINELYTNRQNLQARLDQMKAGETNALTVRVLVSHFRHYGGQVLICAPPSLTDASQ